MGGSGKTASAPPYLDADLQGDAFGASKMAQRIETWKQDALKKGVDSTEYKNWFLKFGEKHEIDAYKLNEEKKAREKQELMDRSAVQSAKMNAKNQRGPSTPGAGKPGTILSGPSGVTSTPAVGKTLIGY